MIGNLPVMVNETVAVLNISRGSISSIIHDVLEFNKMSECCVSRRLTPDLKERRELSRRYEAEGHGFLVRIVTGDESMVHCHLRTTQRSDWLKDF